MTPKDRLRQSSTLRVLLGTQFGVYLTGNTLSLVGTWMQRIAASWLVWDWTGSAFWVGILAACDLLPVVTIAPFAGVAADRWDRVRLNLIAQSISAVNAIALACLFVSGSVTLTALLGLTFIQGSLTAATQPARFAMVQQMVQRADVGRAVGLNSACVNIARLLGPAIAGPLILAGAMIWVFVLNALVTIVFVAILFQLRLAPEHKSSDPETESFTTQLTQGVRYVGRAPALQLILIALFSGGALIRSLVELMPAVAAQSFDDALKGLAILTGAAAFGAVASGVTVGAARTASLYRSAPIWWLIGAVAAVPLTQAGHPAWAVISAALLGACITRGLVSTQTFIQLTTPTKLRGRALAIFGLIARGSPALGALVTGYASDRFGLSATVLVSSGIMVLVVAVLTLPMTRHGRDLAE